MERAPSVAMASFSVLAFQNISFLSSLKEAEILPCHARIHHHHRPPCLFVRLLVSSVLLSCPSPRSAMGNYNLSHVHENNHQCFKLL